MLMIDHDDHDGHDESHDCVNVPAGAVAPEDGTFTFANGTTIHVETGEIAPAAGVYCAESHEDHEEEHGAKCFAKLHVEAEGEYGFLIPADVTLHVLSGGEGHSDHGDNSDHRDHADEAGDHDDPD